MGDYSPTDASRQNSSSGRNKPEKEGKRKKGSGKQDTASPKKAFNAESRRASRQRSVNASRRGSIEDAASRGRTEHLSKKPDAKYKEIKRHLQRKQRELKKQTDAGEERQQEL